MRIKFYTLQAFLLCVILFHGISFAMQPDIRSPLVDAIVRRDLPLAAELYAGCELSGDERVSVADQMNRLERTDLEWFVKAVEVEFKCDLSSLPDFLLGEFANLIVNELRKTSGSGKLPPDLRRINISVPNQGNPSESPRVVFLGEIHNKEANLLDKAFAVKGAPQGAMFLREGVPAGQRFVLDVFANTLVQMITAKFYNLIFGTYRAQLFSQFSHRVLDSLKRLKIIEWRGQNDADRKLVIINFEQFNGEQWGFEPKDLIREETLQKNMSTVRNVSLASEIKKGLRANKILYVSAGSAHLPVSELMEFEELYTFARAVSPQIKEFRQRGARLIPAYEEVFSRDITLLDVLRVLEIPEPTPQENIHERLANFFGLKARCRFADVEGFPLWVTESIYQATKDVAVRYQYMEDTSEPRAQSMLIGLIAFALKHNLLPPKSGERDEQEPSKATARFSKGDFVYLSGLNAAWANTRPGVIIGPMKKSATGDRYPVLIWTADGEATFKEAAIKVENLSKLDLSQKQVTVLPATDAQAYLSALKDLNLNDDDLSSSAIGPNTYTKCRLIGAALCSRFGKSSLSQVTQMDSELSRYLDVAWKGVGPHN